MFTGVVRSKGQLWLANCHAIKVDFHTAGRQVNLQGGTPFLAAVPPNTGPKCLDGIFGLRKAGQWAGGLEGFGDRCSYLVIIGVELSMSAKRYYKSIEALLTDEEMKLVRLLSWRGMTILTHGGATRIRFSGARSPTCGN